MRRKAKEYLPLIVLYGVASPESLIAEILCMMRRARSETAKFQWKRPGKGKEREMMWWSSTGGKGLREKRGGGD